MPAVLERDHCVVSWKPADTLFERACGAASVAAAVPAAATVSEAAAIAGSATRALCSGDTGSARCRPWYLRDKTHTNFLILGGE
ncbi:hypothetical protein GCM10027070_32150 [Barrientosiimonas humi]